ncbi:hypothetical protein LSAT2_020033 [Lamellibrachia satsuma]|nr:hypothetical protein LSAT2_020033 [Lamellibrachia satsuma]
MEGTKCTYMEGTKCTLVEGAKCTPPVLLPVSPSVMFVSNLRLHLGIPDEAPSCRVTALPGQGKAISQDDSVVYAHSKTKRLCHLRPVRRGGSFR